MPLTAAGNLKIVAAADLGDLGATEGPPVTYDWTMSNIMPLLIPWLVILGLLSLKINRQATFWWIFAPLACAPVLMFAPMTFLPSAADFFPDVVAGLVFGVASVYLTADYLHKSYRILTCLLVLVVLAAIGGVAGGFSGSAIQACFLIEISALVTAVALTLVGLSRPRRYSPLIHSLWLLLFIAAIWLTLAAVPFLLASIVSSGRIGWSDFFIPVLSVAMINFAALIPFLILSSLNSKYRERLKALLHMTEAPQFCSPNPLRKT